MLSCNFLISRVVGIKLVVVLPGLILQGSTASLLELSNTYHSTVNDAKGLCSKWHSHQMSGVHILSVMIS